MMATRTDPTWTSQRISKVASYYHTDPRVSQAVEKGPDARRRAPRHPEAYIVSALVSWLRPSSRRATYVEGCRKLAPMGTYVWVADGPLSATGLEHRQCSEPHQRPGRLAEATDEGEGQSRRSRQPEGHEDRDVAPLERAERAGDHEGREPDGAADRFEDERGG